METNLLEGLPAWLDEAMTTELLDFHQPGWDPAPDALTASLDDRPWSADLRFGCYGARFSIRVDHPDVVPSLRDYLPPGWQLEDAPVVDERYSLLVAGHGTDGEPNYQLVRSGVVASSPDLHLLLQQLESDLHWRVAVLARDALFVHAGVVGWQGRAIVLPGRTFSGKSTLVAALVRAGATYYSDEYAILDPSGRVHPFARPLSLREDGELYGRPCSAEALGGRVGSEPLPIGQIVLARYAPGATWRPQTLAPGQALLAMLDNTVLARTRSAEALEILARVVPTAVALQGARGEADEVAQWLLRHLDKGAIVDATTGRETAPKENTE